MKKVIPSYWLQIAVSVIAMLALLAPAQAEPVAPAAKSIKAEETAILLVDFQGNFVSPDGAWYQKFAEHFAKTRMLERMVELVGKARAKGALIVHITEGYTSNYRELDPTNPGGFHRGQISRGAWKIGSKEAAYYEPLKAGSGDRDLFLPPRIQASGFGGTGLNEIPPVQGHQERCGGGIHQRRMRLCNGFVRVRPRLPRLCPARGHGRLLRRDGGPNGQLRLSHVVAGHRQRRFRQDDRSGPGRRKESVGPIVVRLPATAGLTLRPAGASGPTQKSHGE